MRVRLQKYLADSGVASRRKSEEYIRAGRVMVNDKVVTALGSVVDDESDIVKCDEVEIRPAAGRTYIMLYKPEGCVTTVRDQFGRVTVMDYIRGVRARLVPVGRLDYDTSGLLILTDDGKLCERLTHPKHNVKKTYIARISGEINDYKLETMRNGILIGNKLTGYAEVNVIEADRGGGVLSISISEGRNRQVRRMCEAVGVKVVKLKRIAIGCLTIGELKKGEFRMLTQDEVKYLYEISE